MRRQSFYGRKSSLTNKIKRVVLANTEAKCKVLVVNDSQQVAAVPAVHTQLTSIQNGNSPSSKLGNEVLSRLYSRRFYFSNTTANPIYIRVLSFWTKKPISEAIMYDINQYKDITYNDSSIVGTKKVLSVQPSRKYCRKVMDQTIFVSANTMEHRNRAHIGSSSLKNLKIIYDLNEEAADHQNWQFITILYAYSPNIQEGTTGGKQENVSYTYNSEERFFFKDP